jgi:glycosyltransferase involved in cell wall biosynthesis
MIRVLNIQETIGSGGVERLRLSLSRFLNKNKFQLKIICTFTIGNVADEMRANGVEVIEIGRFNSVFDFQQHKKVQGIIAQFRPHIIHGAVFEGVSMAAINGFVFKVPIIIIEETSDPINRSWRGTLLMKLFSLISDKVVAVSPSVEQYLLRTLSISPKKIKLINNGVAMPRVVSQSEIIEMRIALGIKLGNIVLGSVGRMNNDTEKRFSDLIKAMPILLRSGYNVKLLLIGDGPERIGYENLARELMVEEHVVFCGYQSDVAKFYSVMDIFSLVSANESFGLVLAEAMLHKVPVVATRVGGMKYIVDDKHTGFLVDQYDVQQIADKIGILCADENLRHSMGINGYNKALLEYTEERYVNQISELYLSLVEGKIEYG